MTNLTDAQALKPLFIPLKTKYFAQFAGDSKGDELRKYGPRWNEIPAESGAV